MRLLLAVKSCRYDRDRGHHDAIRNTWGSDVKDADLRFFVGQGDTISDLSADEEVVNVSDGYDDLPLKTQAILRWGLTQDYSHFFLCDTDSYIVVSKLMKCGFENADYVGRNTWPLGIARPYKATDRHGNTSVVNTFAWMSGGYGYFLSRKAAEYVVNNIPQIWAEDMFVGNVLGPLYQQGLIKIQNMEPGITFHFPAHEYNSGYDLKFEWMEKMHREHQ